jgi:hypothetical protein
VDKHNIDVNDGVLYLGSVASLGYDDQKSQCFQVDGRDALSTVANVSAPVPEQNDTRATKDCCKYKLKEKGEEEREYAD